MMPSNSSFAVMPSIEPLVTIRFRVYGLGSSFAMMPSIEPLVTHMLQSRPPLQCVEANIVNQELLMQSCPSRRVRAPCHSSQKLYIVNQELLMQSQVTPKQLSLCSLSARKAPLRLRLLCLCAGKGLGFLEY